MTNKEKIMVKVFTTNSNGKIEFTKDELEKLLNEVWQDGCDYNKSLWWTSPTTTQQLGLIQDKNKVSITC